MVTESYVFVKSLAPVERTFAKKLITIAVSGGVVRDCPGGAIATVNYRRQKTSVLILANHFDLLLIARDVTEIL